MEYVIFLLNNKYFGIPILQVIQVSRLQTLQPVPNVSDLIEGSMTVRGVNIAVMDLRKCFKIYHGNESYRSHVMVVTLNQVNIGLIVDKVSDVLNIEDLNIQAAPEKTENITYDKIVSGTVQVKDRQITILDLSRFDEHP